MMQFYHYHFNISKLQNGVLQVVEASESSANIARSATIEQVLHGVSLLISFNHSVAPLQFEILADVLLPSWLHHARFAGTRAIAGRNRATCINLLHQLHVAGAPIEAVPCVTRSQMRQFVCQGLNDVKQQGRRPPSTCYLEPGQKGTDIDDDEWRA